MTIREQLEKTLEMIDKQIEAAKKTAPWYFDGDDYYSMQHPDGTFVLVPLILARAEVLTTLTKYLRTI